MADLDAATQQRKSQVRTFLVSRVRKFLLSDKGERLPLLQLRAEHTAHNTCAGDYDGIE